MLNLQRVTKMIAGKTIIDDINLELPKGTITGLIGANGAGKTTLLKCIADVWQPERGKIQLEQFDTQNKPQVKCQIGFASEEHQVFQYMKVQQLVNWYSDAYPSFSEDVFYRFAEELRIPIKSRPQNMSKGMRMKVSLAIAMAIRPKLLLLDEPANGLDPASRKRLYEWLMEEVADNEMTVLIASHHLGELEQICDHVVMMRNGHILEHANIDDLKRRIRQLQVAFKSDVPKDFNDIPGVLNTLQLGRVVYFTIQGDLDTARQALAQKDALFIDDLDMKLEDIFLHMNEGGIQHEITG